MSNLKLGLQMWSIHNVCVQRGIPAALEMIRKMGYEGFEFALGDDICLKDRCGADVDEVIRALDANGIKAIGSHIPFEPLLDRADRVLEECLKLRLPYAAIGPIFWGDRATVKEQKMLYQKLGEIARLFKRSGIQLQVHCSAFGYLKDYMGRYVVEGMIEEAGIDYLQPEFDTAWMICGQVKPEEMLEKYDGHVDILHFKDYHPLKENYKYLMVCHNTICEEQKDGCAVGCNGVQNIESIIRSAKKCGVQWVVTELWNERNSLEHAKISADNLRKYLS